MVRFSFMTQTAIVFLWRSTPMKFIVRLRVWVNGGLGKTPQVFPRFRGSANRRVDLHLPLIASIPWSSSIRAAQAPGLSRRARRFDPGLPKEREGPPALEPGPASTPDQRARGDDPSPNCRGPDSCRSVYTMNPRSEKARGLAASPPRSRADGGYDCGCHAHAKSEHGEPRNYPIRRVFAASMTSATLHAREDASMPPTFPWCQQVGGPFRARVLKSRFIESRPEGGNHMRIQFPGRCPGLLCPGQAAGRAVFSMLDPRSLRAGGKIG